MDIVQLDVRSAESNLLKITWGKDGSWFPPYHVDRDMLMRDANRIRNSLAQLVNRGLANNKPNAVPACGDVLKEIAEKGADLYTSLFTDSYGTGIPQQVKRWLNRLSGAFRMKVIVENRIQIPWGLIYDADPRGLSGKPQDTDMNMFRNFWCLKFQLSCLYCRIPPPTNEPLDPTVYKVLPVLNKDSFDQATGQLSDEERQLLINIYQNFETPVYTKQELWDKWQSNQSNLGILFFYCHANATRLVLGQDELDIDDFRRKLVRKDWSYEKGPACVVFLSGCRTAVGDLSGGFLEATGGPGYCGFIGTEAEIPDLFALRFSLAFMYGIFYEGLSTIETIHDLRVKHWPLSLLYSLYCDPLLSVQGRGRQDAFLTVLNKNFSSLPVGSQTH